MTHADIQQDLASVIAGLDAMLAARFREALNAGQVAATPAPEDRARLNQAVLHSLAVRSRAGESRDQLSGMAAQAITMVCRPA